MYERVVDYEVQVDSADLVAHFAHRLRDVEARDLRIEGNRIVFRGGMFRFVTNWNLLVPFGHGEIETDPVAHVVRYRLSFAQLLTFATAMIGVMGLFVLLSDPQTLSVLGVLPFMWAWLVGGNLGLGRFRTFVQKSIETAPRTAALHSHDPA